MVNVHRGAGVTGLATGAERGCHAGTPREIPPFVLGGPGTNSAGSHGPTTPARAGYTV